MTIWLPLLCWLLVTYKSICHFIVEEAMFYPYWLSLHWLFTSILMDFIDGCTCGLWVVWLSNSFSYEFTKTVGKQLKLPFTTHFLKVFQETEFRSELGSKQISILKTQYYFIRLFMYEWGWVESSLAMITTLQTQTGVGKAWTPTEIKWCTKHTFITQKQLDFLYKSDNINKNQTASMIKREVRWSINKALLVSAKYKNCSNVKAAILETWNVGCWNGGILKWCNVGMYM